MLSLQSISHLLFILAMNIILEIEVEMNRIYDCICIYMNVYMYVKKKIYIYIIQPPKISTAECP